jgi:hypothetical protein
MFVFMEKDMSDFTQDDCYDAALAAVPYGETLGGVAGGAASGAAAALSFTPFPGVSLPARGLIALSSAIGSVGAIETGNELGGQLAAGLAYGACEVGNGTSDLYHQLIGQDQVLPSPPPEEGSGAYFSPDLAQADPILSGYSEIAIDAAPSTFSGGYESSPSDAGNSG